MLTVDHLTLYGRGIARAFIRDHPSRSPSTEFIAYAIATEYLREVVGNEWTNQTVFGMHPTVTRTNRPGRAFLRAEATDSADGFRNLERVVSLAEMLFNLKDVDGIGARIDDLRNGVIESTYAELESGDFLYRRGITFRYVDRTGQKGADFDAVLPLEDGSSLPAEMKAKAETTELSANGVENILQNARSQLPPGTPGLIFLKLPEAWIRNPDVAAIVTSAVNGFLRGTTRVIAVILQWEEQHAVNPEGALTLYKFRLERGATPKPVSAAVESILKAVVVSEPNAAWVEFAAVAAQALGPA
jgi:hypothetical protein